MFKKISNSKILIIVVPSTYVDSQLVPTGIFPITTLKLISYLKTLNNKVEYIDMRSTKYSHFWKYKPAGLRGKIMLPFMVRGKKTSYLIKSLKEIDFYPDTVILELYSTWNWYSYDIDLAETYINIIKKFFPLARYVLGGDSFRYFSNEIFKTNYEILSGNLYYSIFSQAPYFKIMDKWEYGVFQLMLGCNNNCTFCFNNMNTPFYEEPEKVINYMKNFYKKNKVKTFWCWDPNVLIDKNKFLNFIELFKEANFKSNISFGRGFQPNILNEEDIKKIKDVSFKVTAIPIENATSNIKKYQKSYNVISTIKFINMLKQYKINTRNFMATFMLGYPDDDFNEIMRSLLIGSYLNLEPSPFPIFLAPFQRDMQKYYSLIKHKKLEELHGHLFPLIEDKNVIRYYNLVRFFKKCEKFKDIPKYAYMIDKELRDILMKELEIIPLFVKLCQDVKNSTMEELIKIEKEVTRKRISNAKRYKNKYINFT